MKTNEILNRDPQLKKELRHGLSIEYRDNNPSMFYPPMSTENITESNNSRKLSGLRTLENFQV